MLGETVLSEVLAILYVLPALAGLEAVRRLPDAEGEELALCVLVLFGVTALGGLAYLVLGLVVPLFMLGLLGVMLILSFLL